MTNRRLGSTSLAVPTRSNDSRNEGVFRATRARRLADVETVERGFKKDSALYHCGSGRAQSVRPRGFDKRPTYNHH